MKMRRNAIWSRRVHNRRVAMKYKRPAMTVFFVALLLVTVGQGGVVFRQCRVPSSSHWYCQQRIPRSWPLLANLADAITHHHHRHINIINVTPESYREENGNDSFLRWAAITGIACHRTRSSSLLSSGKLIYHVAVRFRLIDDRQRLSPVPEPAQCQVLQAGTDSQTEEIQ